MVILPCTCTAWVKMTHLCALLLALWGVMCYAPLMDNTQLARQSDEPPQDLTEKSTTAAIISGKLLPLALSVYEDVMVNGKTDKARLDAANAVTELQGLRTKGSVQGPSLTVNVPPEYLVKSLKALGGLRLAPREDVIDV